MFEILLLLTLALALTTYAIAMRPFHRRWPHALWTVHVDATNVQTVAKNAAHTRWRPATTLTMTIRHMLMITGRTLARWYNSYVRGAMLPANLHPAARELDYAIRPAATMWTTLKTIARQRLRTRFWMAIWLRMWTTTDAADTRTFCAGA